jgi:ribulose-phosphate 3-epimerase
VAVICPTVTAFDTHQYREQMELLEKFAKRIHIDLMDGVFAPTKSPPLETVWWPDGITADIHIMYQKPGPHLEQLIKLKPHLVVIHAGADVDHKEFAAKLHGAGIKAGLGLLPDVTVDSVKSILDSFDHVMVFGGRLGYHGSKADFNQLHKVEEIRRLYPKMEIAWDGGVNDENAKQLVDGGVDVLNVGGFIHKAEDPRKAYAKLVTIAKGP